VERSWSIDCKGFVGIPKLADDFFSGPNGFYFQFKLMILF